MEKWKDIKEYEGLYQVSNLGNIKSLPRATTKGKILVKNLDYDGYQKVTLSKLGVHKQFSVHKLVATAFIPNPNNFTEINHIDENKANNSVDNLEWCTSTYNIHYGTCISRRSYRRKVKISQYDLQGNFIREWNGAVDAERILNISRKQISACLRENHKSAGGFIWKYNN